MGSCQPGRMTRPLSAALVTVLGAALITLGAVSACAGGAAERERATAPAAEDDAVADDAAVDSTLTGNRAPAQETPPPPRDEPQRPAAPTVAGGYAATAVDAEIVVESVEVLEEALEDGVRALMQLREGAAAADRPAPSLRVTDLDAVAGCETEPLEVDRVTTAATQVVAGTNVWFSAEYTCGEIHGELAAIVFWTLDSTSHLTDLDLRLTKDDRRP
jgi:type IV secretory pathway VirB10-like protein